MGVKPVAIAGTSIGAIIGAGYAAGMSGRDMRRYAIQIMHNRTDDDETDDEIARRQIQQSVRRRASATPPDSTPRNCASNFLPDALPDDFKGLAIPLTVVASDLYRRRQVVFSQAR